jgi:general nucleoside transport system permease protein
MSARRRPLPRWIDIGVLPVVNVAMAFLIAGLIVLAIGVSPLQAVRLLVIGALGDPEAIGYTLYYATNFVFTGLAVALVVHGGLFNIGGEGQATIGGLGAGLVLLAVDATLPPVLAVALGVAAAAAFGAAWAAVPAWLQAYRGSHIVITTIMFNFIASALMVYLLVNVLIVPGSMSPASREFAASTHLVFIHELIGLIGVAIAPSPLNVSVFLAIACCVLVWVLLWHTPWGYELRVLGHNAEAAVYAGVNSRRMTLVAMGLSGALAGCVGVNEILGVHHRLILNFAAGYGFGGIAVAMMGRNHPVGVVLASLLFGVLYQGGAELAFEIPAITREMVVVIQGLVILFSGVLANLIRPGFERLVDLWPRPDGAADGVPGTP